LHELGWTVLLASAAIRLASTANPSPATNPAAKRRSRHSD
jgi:hypothetical protein